VPTRCSACALEGAAPLGRQSFAAAVLERSAADLGRPVFAS
jgi:hypothetical protein